MIAKKSFIALLSAALLLASAACSGKPAVSDASSGAETASGGQTLSTGVTTAPSGVESGEATGTSGAASTTKTNKNDKPAKTTTKSQGDSIPTKVIVNQDDNKTYPNFGGATIVFATYSKRPELNGDTQNDARVYALEWAEKKYNCKVEYKVYDSAKLDEAFTAASLSNSFFADIVTANCIGYVGWCLGNMLEETDKYLNARTDKERWNTEIGRFQEKHYGIDAFTSSIVWPEYMIYNADMLKELGLEDPKELAKKGEWDFDTFREYCKAATNKSKGTYGVACFGFDSILQGGADFEALVQGTKDGQIWYYNGYAHQESGSYDKALKILTLMQQMRNVDKSVLGDNTGGLQPVLDAEEAFSKGKLLFLEAGDARALTIRKTGMKNFSVVTHPTLEKGQTAKYSWVASYAFTAFPKRTEKSLSKASSKNISMDDLVAFWMDANTTWNQARGNAYYEEDFELAVVEKAANYLCSEADAQFLYDMGKNMSYKVTYAQSLETGNEVIAGLHMPVLLGQKTPAAAIKQTDANIQKYADNTWNKR